VASETSRSRDILSKYCVGFGMDVGYGGDRIVPSAWAFDLPTPYTSVGEDRQQLRGSCASFDFLCDNALDYIYSSHVLEDFTYIELVKLLEEWKRVLKPGGLIITNCPDQQRFLAHCAATGQSINDNHKEPDFSLCNFWNVLKEVGSWESVYEMELFENYSWLLVVKKNS